MKTIRVFELARGNRRFVTVINYEGLSDLVKKLKLLGMISYSLEDGIKSAVIKRGKKQ